MQYSQRLATTVAISYLFKNRNFLYGLFILHVAELSLPSSVPQAWNSFPGCAYAPPPPTRPTSPPTPQEEGIPTNYEVPIHRTPFSCLLRVACLSFRMSFACFLFSFGVACTAMAASKHWLTSRHQHGRVLADHRVGYVSVFDYAAATWRRCNHGG